MWEKINTDAYTVILMFAKKVYMTNQEIIIFSWEYAERITMIVLKNVFPKNVQSFPTKTEYKLHFSTTEPFST